MPMFSVREVDGVRMAATINSMQRTCLPEDCIYPTSHGWWRLAYYSAVNDKIPVAFAGLNMLTGVDEGTGYLCRCGVLPEFRGHRLQARLIRAREAKARALGGQVLVADTNDNPESGNSLIRCGFRLYQPENEWALPTSCYWRKLLVSTPPLHY